MPDTKYTSREILERLLQGTITVDDALVLFIERQRINVVVPSWCATCGARMGERC